MSPEPSNRITTVSSKTTLNQNSRELELPLSVQANASSEFTIRLYLTAISLIHKGFFEHDRFLALTLAAVRHEAC